MMSTYEPELGQALFGQPHQQFAVPDIVEAALIMIECKLNLVMWNKHQKEYDSPFSNTGNKFSNAAFSAYAYSWDDEEQPYNFKWRDIEISWYKYLGRGMSANREIDATTAEIMLTECLASLDTIDDVETA